VSMLVNRSHEPSYAGIPTFCKVPLALDPDGLADADVVIIGAPMDGRVTNRPGARLGPRGVRNSCPTSFPTRPHVSLGVDPLASLRIVDYGDVQPKPAGWDDDIELLHQRVAEVLLAGARPIVIGGDHSLAFATITAISERHGADGFFVVQLDSHTDTGEAPGERLTHGTPVRLLVQQGKVRGDRITQIGLRGYWPDAPVFDWMQSVGIRWQTMADIDNMGIEAITSGVIDTVEPLGIPMYLSVDIDVLDPAFAPGTGTPEPGGLTTRELFYVLRTLTSHLPLAGMEVVEVCPPYDQSEITALAAHRCILEALSGMVAGNERFTSASLATTELRSRG
jgi:agmatinase